MKETDLHKRLSYPRDVPSHFMHKFPWGIQSLSPIFGRFCASERFQKAGRLNDPWKQVITWNYLSVPIFIFVRINGFRKQVYWIYLACHLRLCDYVCLHGLVPFCASKSAQKSQKANSFIEYARVLISIFLCPQGARRPVYTYLNSHLHSCVHKRSRLRSCASAWMCSEGRYI